MAYAALDDIRDRWGEDMLFALAPASPDDPEPPASGLDETAIATALADAAAEIDLALRGRYTLPVVGEIPPVLVRLCVDIAVAMLPRDAAGDGETIQARAKAARKLLESIARGTLRLDVAESKPTGSGGVAFKADPSPFAGMVEKY